jgi:hypothetical protein
MTKMKKYKLMFLRLMKVLSIPIIVIALPIVMIVCYIYTGKLEFDD